MYPLTAELLMRVPGKAIPFRLLLDYLPRRILWSLTYSMEAQCDTLAGKEFRADRRDMT